MTSRAAVEGFLAQRRIAVVGVSRGGKKFGNLAYRALRERGYSVVPIHPEAESLEGDVCAPSLGALPEPVGGVLVVVPPAAAEKVVDEAAAAGIRHVWLQQGSSSAKAVEIARERGMNVVAGECIMMFTEPVKSIHGFHRWLWKVLGKLPS